MKERNLIEWLSKWFYDNCNGDWEHNFGVSIETIDNPGWSITIDTEGSNMTLEDRPWCLFEKTAFDWYGYKIENGKFEASGDPFKLEFLIHLFKEQLDNPATVSGPSGNIMPL